MEEQNKNMEEFLRKAMDGFNESPSDNLWDEINDQLDANEPFYKKYLNWKFIFIPLLISGLFCGNVYWYSKSKLSTEQKHFIIQKDQANKTNKENSTNLNDDLVLSQLKVKALEEELLALKNKIKTPENKLPSNLNQIQTSLTKSAAKSYPIPPSNSFITSFDRSSLEKSKTDDRQPKQKKFPFNSLNKNQNKIGSQGVSSFDKQGNLSESENEESRPKQEIFEIPQIEKNKVVFKNDESLGIKVNDVSLLTSKKSGLLSFLKPFKLPDLNLQRIPTIDKSGRFLFGLTIATFFTHVNEKFEAIPNGKAGINLEYQINPSLSIASSANYNYLQYHIKNPSDADLSNLPLPLPNENIREVEVRNSYFDFHLGLVIKKELNPKFRLFVHPSLAWQFYLPQTFDYEFASTTPLPNPPRIEVSPKRFFGYFGSLNVDLGFEKDLGSMFSYRLAVYTEKTFIPLGLEKANYINVGLKSTFIFGGTL